MLRRQRAVTHRLSGCRSIQELLVLAVLAATGVALTVGCGNNEIGRYAWENTIVKNPQRVRNLIVKSEDYWVQKEIRPEEQFPGPTPADLTPPRTDYVIGSDDLIDVTVYELLAPGQPYVSRQRVTQGGQITLPYIGSVKATGLTVRGLEEKVSDILQPDYLTNPQVTVFVVEYRNLSVSVLAGMFRPGMYQMPKQDMTLLELVAQAGGIVQLVEDYGYVIRKYSPQEADLLILESGLPSPEAAAPPAPQDGSSGATRQDRDMLQKMAEGQMPSVEQIEGREVSEGQVRGVEPAVPDDGGQVGRWIWKDGQWVEVQPAETTAGPPATLVESPSTASEAPLPPADLSRLELERKLARLGVVRGSGQLKRIIRFDVEALMAGDPTQDIVLRDGDVITIPSPPAGDFYMAGEVARPGVYSLTGRKITLLQAVAAAGGLTAVAVPWRTEVVRRVSEEQEEIIYVDLAKIARGDVPDFYVHPEDLIRVGTDQSAIYDAVLRNAFRATYGFGAVYDTNFADFYPWTDAAYPLFPGLH